MAVRTALLYLLVASYACSPSKNSASSGPSDGAKDEGSDAGGDSPGGDDASNEPTPILQMSLQAAFGQVLVGESSVKSITVTSNGDVEATDVVVSQPSAPFALTTTCGATIAPKASCDLSLTFAPTTTGVVERSLVVTYKVAGETLSATMALSGEGVTTLVSNGGKPTLQAISEPSTAAVGTTATLSYKVIASESQALSNLQIVAPPGFSVSSNSCAADLAAGDDCSFDVTATCADASDKAGSMALNYTLSSGDFQDTKAISVNCQTPAALAISSPNQTGTTPLGQTRDVTFTVTNSGQFTAADLSAGGLAQPFSIHSSTCGSTLAGGSTCTIVVRFRPLGISAYSDTLEVAYHDGLSSTQADREQVGDGDPGHIVVESVYDSGDTWGRRVDITDTTKDHWHQPSDSYNVFGGPASVHSGELKKAEFEYLESCAGLTATDSREAFKWFCVEENDGITFYSGGLKEHYGLRDLLNGPTWFNMSLTVKSGSDTILASTPTPWWNNTIEVLPDSSAAVQTLTGANKVFWLGSTVSSKGLIIGSDNISIAIESNHSLNFSGNATNCSTDGQTGTSTKTLICAGITAQLWIEGNFDGSSVTSGTGYGIHLAGNSDVEIRNSNFKKFRTAAINVKQHGTSNAASDISINNVRVAEGGSASSGIAALMTTRIRIKDAHLSGLYYGLSLESASNCAIQGVYASGNVSGIRLDNSPCIVSQVTTANNSTSGSEFLGIGTVPHVANLLSFNDHIGVTIASNAAIKNAMILTAETEVYLSTGLAVPVFEGFLKIDATPNCFVQVGASGLTDGTCANDAPSNVTLQSGIDATDTLKKLGENDSANPHDGATGMANYDDITEWTKFLNTQGFWSLERAYGKSGTVAVPNVDQQGRCATTEACSIWSLRPQNGSPALNAGAGGAFAEGQPCPTGANGNDTFGGGSYLINAQEIQRDGRGNENGICESNERCTVSPHLGAFQRGVIGVSSGTCDFTNGTVTGVSMFN